MSSSISNSMSWVSSMSLVLCSTSFRKHRYPFSTVPTKRLLKCLLMDSTSTKEERRPAGTGKTAVRSSGEHRRPVLSKDTRNQKARRCPMNQMTGRGSSKVQTHLAGESPRERSQLAPGAEAQASCIPRTPKGRAGWLSTCETLEGISLLQVCTQRGLLQGQQAGDFLNRMTSSVMGPPLPPSQDAAHSRGA